MLYCGIHTQGYYFVRGEISVYDSVKKTTRSLLVMLVLNLSAAAALASEWSSYSSENFTVYSDLRYPEAIELVKEFEVFRELAFFVLGLPPSPSNRKLQILVFASRSEYRNLRAGSVVGFYIETPAGPRMVVGPGRGIVKQRSVLFHEYIHYLMREHSAVIYPRWYSEGWAEVLGATTLSGRKATIGAIPENRARWIRSEEPFEIRELLQPNQEEDSNSYSGRYYAYAWLFTHYLEIGSLREHPEVKGQTFDYMQRFNRGEDPQSAFLASFGKSPEAMDRALRTYRNQSLFTVVTFEREEYRGEIDQVRLTPGEQAFLLADLAWRIGDEELALEYLEDFDHDDASNSRALSLAGVLMNQSEEEDAIALAKSYTEQALALAGHDTQILTNYARWLADTRERLSEQNPTQTVEIQALIQEQIEASQTAISNDPSNLEALQLLWRAQTEIGDQFAALQTMMQAYQVEPHTVRMNETIGRHLIELNRSDLALPFIERARNWTHSSEQRQEMDSLLNEIRQASSGIEK